ncbi:hypothetical protein [Hoeflea sp.]|uniref:hypothetical protein n=1 Tax=Hoeflea sp. TaxID=1940281 RepID=UPI003B5284FB
MLLFPLVAHPGTCRLARRVRLRSLGIFQCPLPCANFIDHSVAALCGRLGLTGGSGLVAAATQHPLNAGFQALNRAIERIQGRISATVPA